MLIQEIFGVTDHIRDASGRLRRRRLRSHRAVPLRSPAAQASRPATTREGVARGRALSEAAPWDEVAATCRPAWRPWLRRCSPSATAGAVRRPGSPPAAARASRRRLGLLWPAHPRTARRDAALPDHPPLRPPRPEHPPRRRSRRSARRYPEVPIHLYDAGHGFASDRRADYRPDAARLARLRTLQLFALNGGGRGEV